MIFGSLSYRVPSDDYHERLLKKNKIVNKEKDLVKTYKDHIIIPANENVHVKESIKTPQFYLLWIILCSNVTAGIALIGYFKQIMTDIFSNTLPNIVTPYFTSLYITMISVFNTSGRLFFSTLSDYIGRKMTYNIFWFRYTFIFKFTIFS